MLKMNLALLPILLLSACGGSGSDSSSTPSSSTDSVALASQQLVSSTGAQALSGSSDATVFDLTASIGDSWRLTLKSDGTFAFKVLQTQYGLADVSGSYSVKSAGVYRIYSLTDSSGAQSSLTLDTRTQTLAGVVSLGGKISSVAGSAYAMPSDLGKLAGIYNYIHAARNASDSSNPYESAGTLKISGASLLLCDELTINSFNQCVDDKGVTSSPQVFALTSAANGLVSAAGLGLLHFLPGDHGPVLVIDQFNQNSEGVWRTGAFYAASQRQLTGTELDGSWTCAAASGSKTVGFTAVGTTMKTSDNTTDTLHYNRIWSDSVSGNLLEWNGFVTDVDGQSGTAMVPLSSSLAVVEVDSLSSLAVCYRAG